MLKIGLAIAACTFGLSIATCQASDSAFKLALPNHAGQLSWTAEGYDIVQSSAKPNSNEIGIRGRNKSGTQFLGFLFLVPGQAPLTSDKCRDGAMHGEKGSNPSLKILRSLEITNSSNLPVSLVSYTAQGADGKTIYVARGFVATADLCGDLEFYGDSPVAADANSLKQLFSSYQLDQKYTPTYRDVFLYAQILYQEQQFKAAAPLFQSALGLLKESHETDQITMRRVLTDQAGMAYGISGDISKARSIFEKAIAQDPDYPLYYYNLACADAEEKNLAGAEK